MRCQIDDSNLLKKSAVTFVLRRNSIKKIDFPILSRNLYWRYTWGSKFINSEYAILFKIQNSNSVFVLFPIQDPTAKFRFDVLFKKIRPRINLTTFSKFHLLNTIKQFSSHENSS
jgi:hypothetical protein